MRPSILASTLAIGAHAAPAFPRLNLTDLANPANALDALSDYFNSIAVKVQTARVRPVAPACDVSRAQMPLVDGLPAPSTGLTVRHVAVGRGTQNYTCEPDSASASPKAIGAVATLFNVSCMAAVAPDLLEKVPGMAVNFGLNLQTAAGQLGPMAVPVSGIHYFADSATPFFDLDTPVMNIGQAPCSKNSSVPAPAAAAVGQQGEAAVAWLKLTAKEGVTGDIKEVYRVNTAGGSPPATCQGMPEAFEVQYSAVYWFWQGDD